MAGGYLSVSYKLILDIVRQILMRVNKPKLPLNITPGRVRQVQNGYYSTNDLPSSRQHQNLMCVGNISPNKIHNTNKPLIQKTHQQKIPLVQRKQTKQNQFEQHTFVPTKRTANQNYCVNHPDRQANYKVKMQDETLYCCFDCSNKIMDQGFQVENMAANGNINIAGVHTILSSRRQSTATTNGFQFQHDFAESLKSTSCQNFQLHGDPSISRKPRFLKLQQFVNECKGAIVSFQQNIEGFSQIQGHYIEQQRLIGEFYESMIDHMRCLKGQHLNLLRNQSNKYTKIAEIDSCELQQFKQIIEQLVKDIVNSVDDIVLKIREQDFTSTMNLYRQKIQIAMHRVEQQRTTFEEVTKLDKRDLEHRLQQFISITDDLFNIKQNIQKRPTKPITKQTFKYRNRAQTQTGLEESNSMNLNGRSSKGLDSYITKYTTHTNNKSPFNRFEDVQGEYVDCQSQQQGMAEVMKYNTVSSTHRHPKAKPNNNAPFRTLFGEDSSTQSPQFKNI